MDITNIKFDQEVHFTRDMRHFTDMPKLNPIPNKTIIYKTLTGIGATYCEIKAKRSSIIVLPHISIVKSKHELHKETDDTLAIYGDITTQEVADYLTKDSEFAKILTTPKGLNKVIRILNFISISKPEISYKNLFFLLIDECHKFIKDADYRTDMVEVMDHFFEFENKAMISATPIPPSDPRVKKDGFQHLRVVPERGFKQNINLIPVVSLVNGLKKYLEQNHSKHYCIFFNSIEGIRDLILQLKLENNYRIFCSQESQKLLSRNGETNSAWVFDQLTQYNFFTSSFFNGLDIELDYKPDIIILTDCGYRDHTILDPYTDILQIIGRFRKPEDADPDYVPYNKVTHINNATHFTNPITQDTARLMVEHSKHVYTQINTLIKSTVKVEHSDLYKQARATVKPYSRLVNKDDNLSYFLLDNYLDDERVKTYYKSTLELKIAYLSTELYNVFSDNQSYITDTYTKLRKSSLRYSSSMIKTVANELLALAEYKGIDIYYQQRDELEKLFLVVVRAFDLLGYATMRSLKFSKRKIEDELLKLAIENNKNSVPMINIVYKNFQLNKYYPDNTIKAELQKLYDEFGIKSKAKATDLKRYFIGKIQWKVVAGVNTRHYVFTSRKLFAIEAPKHI